MNKNIVRRFMMAIKIVVDSCCDVTPQMKNDMNLSIAPLTLYVEDKTFVDDETLDIQDLLQSMKKSKKAAKTACPSPEEYMNLYKGEDSVFVVTLSSALSGSYNSAVLAKKMLLEEVGNKFIHVFDSLSACVGETLVSLKISELASNGLSETEIVQKVNDYIKEMKTLFLLENLDNLVKNGRINPVIAKIISVLNIRPIMGSTDEGTIQLVEKARGFKKAFTRLAEIIGEQGEQIEDKVLGIAHCNCFERALAFKEEALKRYNFKDIVIVEMRGVSTIYANDGGIVIAF